jgi:hypothetical protein
LNFKLDLFRKIFIEQEKQYLITIIAFTLVTPLILFLFVAMDLLFLSVSTILAPLFILSIVVLRDVWLVEKIQEKLDKIYSMIFGLNKINLEGFRRLRTSS